MPSNKSILLPNSLLFILFLVGQDMLSTQSIRFQLQFHKFSCANPLTKFWQTLSACTSSFAYFQNLFGACANSFSAFAGFFIYVAQQTGACARTSNAVSKTTSVCAKIDFSTRLQHTINFFDEGTPNKKAKPEGVHGCEIWAKIGGDAPKDQSELAYLATDTGSPYLKPFTSPDAGKTAYYWLRWVNTKGEQGPWSAPVSAMIAG